MTQIVVTREKSSPTQIRAARFTAQQDRVHRRASDWTSKIADVSDGKRRTDAQITATTGVKAPVFLQRVRLIPWLAVDRTHIGTIFIIDDELRAICDGRAPMPALGNKSIRMYLQDLRAEITRRREENNDEFRKRNWNSELILKREQTSLLDWIEDQLNQLPN